MRTAQRVSGVIGRVHSIARRLATDIRVASELSRSGVRLGSILRIPIDRRTRGLIELRLRGGWVLAAPRNEPLPFLYREIWIEHAYGSLPDAIGLTPTVVDIGAHIGVYTVWAATDPSRPRVVAVEPAPRALEFLARNVSANKLSNVTIVPAACAGQDGEGVLQLSGPMMMSTLYSRAATRAEHIPVPLITLDRLFKEHQIERCDLLKLDCEGAEFDILLACRDETLRRVRRIAMEYHRWAGVQLVDKLSRRLTSLGFSVDRTDGQDGEHGYMRADAGTSEPVPVAARPAEPTLVGVPQPGFAG
jgi:FkbM family methyltransferase